MNGTFFIYDNNPASSNKATTISGKSIFPYLQENSWVLSREPEKDDSEKWQALYNMGSGKWITKLTQSTLIIISLLFESMKPVDINVVGPFVDFVIQYKFRKENSTDPDRSLYYRYRNTDSLFITTDYSIKYEKKSNESILGPYEDNQTYIKQFNNSVMIYPNIRMNIMGNTVISYSYTQTPDRIGTVLIPFGDLIEDYIPGFYLDNGKQYFISKTGTGYIRIIRLGTSVPNRIERIAQYVHKINTVDVMNILVERNKKITVEHGSLDWNNKFEINNKIETLGAQTERKYHVNSAYNPKYEMTGLRSSSMLADDTSFNLYGQLFNQETLNGFNLNFINAFLAGGSIDVYYDEVQPSKYRFSINNNVQRFNSQFEGQEFPLGVIVPFPLGTKWSLHNEVIAVGEMSQDLLAVGLTWNNKTLDAYIFSKQIYFGQASFNLFGIQYIFDGDYIYQESDRIAMAFGYAFVGSDNQAAYFYNLWDKSIYLFTGSRTLNKFIDLTNRALVKIGRYDGFSGEMILLTEDEVLKSREGVIMNFPYKPGNLVIPTKKGPYIEIDNGDRLLLSPRDGEIDIFEIQTEFIGVDGSTVCDYERIDIRLYSPDKMALIFLAEMQTINQDTKESEQKLITFKGGDWSSDGYKTIKLIPQYKKGTGLSLRIYCEQAIYIAGIEFTYEPVARTGNSQRSGF